MTPPPTNGASHAFAIGRNHFLTVFGKKTTKARSEAESCLSESSATLGHTPLPDGTERAFEREIKKVWRENPLSKKFCFNSSPSSQGDGEGIWEETTPKNKSNYFFPCS